MRADRAPRMPVRFPSWVLVAMSVLGSYLSGLAVFGPAPFSLFWGFVVLSVVPAAALSTRSRSVWLKLPVYMASAWCFYLAVGSGATYL